MPEIREGAPVEERAIEELGERFAGLRLSRPRAEAAMERSLATYGQISPVVCARIGGTSGHELIDGFKRLRASRRLKKPSLLARTLDLTARAAKAACWSSTALAAGSTPWRRRWCSSRSVVRTA